jgi:hypothetical protein
VMECIVFVFHQWMLLPFAVFPLLFPFLIVVVVIDFNSDCC